MGLTEKQLEKMEMAIHKENSKDKVDDTDDFGNVGVETLKRSYAVKALVLYAIALAGFFLPFMTGSFMSANVVARGFHLIFGTVTGVGSGSPATAPHISVGLGITGQVFLFCAALALIISLINLLRRPPVLKAARRAGVVAAVCLTLILVTNMGGKTMSGYGGHGVVKVSYGFWLSSVLALVGTGLLFVGKRRIKAYEVDDEDDDQPKHVAIGTTAAVLSPDQRFNPQITYSSFIDMRDGTEYRTVKIGNKTWMAENLKFETGNSWCYENNINNCQLYGRLYDRDTALDACPAGWRLPTDADWSDLEQTAGGRIAAGKKLKSVAGWKNNGNGSDNFGFSALPGGVRNANGGFSSIGYDGSWWSATDGEDGRVRYRKISADQENLNEQSGNKDFGASVRCVCD
ncbi:MAG: fibrobacter succinogenes major paralogous domain-containing protein [Chitinispirillales bacterium]|jgi:uncharacterized protein (TIGR02145 family)|nr:fibrobacter succinogenes major paralogous domain-containing protein [Chitinispirillales bacterium]